MERRTFLRSCGGLVLAAVFGCGAREERDIAEEGPPPSRFPPRPTDKKPKSTGADSKGR